MVQTPTLCCSTEDGPGAARLGSHTLPPAALKPQLLPANLRPGFLSLLISGRPHFSRSPCKDPAHAAVGNTSHAGH